MTPSLKNITLYHLSPPPAISSGSSAASGLFAGSPHVLFPLPGMLSPGVCHHCSSYNLRFLLKCSPEISSYNHPTLGSAPSLLDCFCFLHNSVHYRTYVCLLSASPASTLKSGLLCLLVCPSIQNRHSINIC